jgi:hypothetical protein
MYRDAAQFVDRFDLPPECFVQIGRRDRLVTTRLLLMDHG